MEMVRPLKQPLVKMCSKRISISYDNKSLDVAFHYRQGDSSYIVLSRGTAFSWEMSGIKFGAAGELNN